MCSCSFTDLLQLFFNIFTQGKRLIGVQNLPNFFSDLTKHVSFAIGDPIIKAGMRPHVGVVPFSASN